MKRINFLSMFLLVAMMAFAQADVTTFLGIPVDGTKSAMRQKLIGKGFVPKTVGGSEFFEGEFNGMDVNIYIVTNNNKVYRLMICDALPRSEADIKIRFNTLVAQFQNNKRYATVQDYTISESEMISYEMTVHKKNYEAVFYQIPDPEKIDTLAVQTQIRNELLQKYTPEQLENPTEELIQELQNVSTRIAMELILMRPVWFRIRENYGEYYISMFYDNEYNHANGEDL